MEETVQAVVEFALQALDCSYAGVALILSGGRLKIPAVTDPVVAEIRCTTHPSTLSLSLAVVHHISAALVRPIVASGR